MSELCRDVRRSLRSRWVRRSSISLWFIDAAAPSSASRPRLSNTFLPELPLLCWIKSMLFAGLQRRRGAAGDSCSAGCRGHGGSQDPWPPQHPDLRLAVLQLLPWTLPEWVSMSQCPPPLSLFLIWSVSLFFFLICVSAHSRWHGRDQASSRRPHRWTVREEEPAGGGQGVRLV